MKRRLALIITLSLGCSLPTYGMLSTAIKKFTLNQMQRCYATFSYARFTGDNLPKAPLNISNFLEKMPKKLNLADIKDIPNILKIDTLDSENKDLMLADLLDSMYKFHCYPYESRSPNDNKVYDDEVYDDEVYDDEVYEDKLFMATAYLIRAGANPDTLIEYFSGGPSCIIDIHNAVYPLERALVTNNIELISFLLNHGADVHGPKEMPDLYQEPIFFVRTIEAAELLFNHNFNLNAKDYGEYYSGNILPEAIFQRRPFELIELYIKHGANPLAIGRSDVRPSSLHSLIYWNDHPELLRIAELLIQIAPDAINIKNVNGKTPLDLVQNPCHDPEDGSITQPLINMLKKNGAKKAEELKKFE